MPSRFFLRLTGAFIVALLLSSTAYADATPPAVTSILRQSPTTTWTTGTSATWRVTFSEAVTGVTTSAFTLTATGSAAGTVASVSAVTTSVYDVTANALVGSGDLRLDLNSSGTGIADTDSNAPAAGFIAGQRYTHVAGTTPVAWGYNGQGQLGNNSTTTSLVPAAVITSGVLADKTVVALAASEYHTLALTADGQVFAWGFNCYGQLGNNSTTASLVPVAVTTSGALSGKTIVAIAAGEYYSLALSADGQVFAWGYNVSGQLGDGSTSQRNAPVAVTITGVLVGQTLVAIAAGGGHSLALGADGRMFAWGLNTSGQLGNSSTTTSNVPVAVTATGVLAGKTLVAIAAGGSHSLALSADGLAFAWGAGSNGQLGNNSTSQSSVPVAVTTAGVLAGKALVALSAGQYHSLALSADGLAFAWGRNVNGQLGNNSTSQSNVPVAADTSGVLAGKTLVALAAGCAHSMALSSDGRVFGWGYDSFGQLGDNTTNLNTLTPVATVASGVLAGKQVIALAPGAFTYQTHGLIDGGVIPTVTSLVRQSPTTTWTTDTSVTWRVTFNKAVTGVTINAFALTTTGSASGTVASVSAISTSVYDVTVSSLAGSGSLRLDLKSSTSIADANGHVPAGFIAGQRYTHIATTIPAAWGANASGQLGINSMSSSWVPAVVTSGVGSALEGKTVVSVATGKDHSLALTSDGQVFAWGSNGHGQLGKTGTSRSTVPLAVTSTGVLAGKTIVAIAAGLDHSLALSSDGQVFAWGYNSYGQLGDGSTTDSSVPVAIDTSGVLIGKTIVALAAGIHHSLALSSDGQIFAWGYNAEGELGDNSTDDSLVPVAVDATGVLAGETIVALASGAYHSLALSADGQIFAWGQNAYGQLGDGSTNDSPVPVAVDATGVLAGKSIVALAAGLDHSLALSADGQVFAWGENTYGQLGDGSTTDSPVPIAVDTTGILSGQTIVALAGGMYQSLALNAAGRVSAWGRNASGQLGNNSVTNSSVPVAVDSSGVVAGRKFIALASGWAANHSLGLFDGAPIITSLVRQSPATAWTTGGSVTWRATFSKAVTGVTTGSFTLTSTGSASGTITAVTAVSTTVYEITVSTLAGSGDLRLDLKSSGNGITNTAGTAAAFGYNAGQRYTHIAATTPVAWGSNASGQLGHNSTTASLVPATVDTSGVLAGKTLVALAAGNTHSLALTSDGQLFAWGDNSSGQLGNNSTTASLVPVAVDTSASLAGQTIVAVAACAYHSVVLSSTGHLYAWGYNGEGELGNNSTTNSLVPVAVGASGALSGKTIVTIAAGRDFTLALSSSGQVFAWGTNYAGQLGNNSTTSSSTPVAVDTGGAFADKTIVALAAGWGHSLALSSDGQVFAWGWNSDGQLGDNSTANRLVPTAIDTSGVLAGKTLVAVAAGQLHSLALTSDGQAFAWGYNGNGLLGDNSMTPSLVPVAVDTSGVLAGKQVIALTAGPMAAHSLGLVAAALNTAPTVPNALADQPLTYGTAFTYTVPANAFADADTGQTLTYTATGLPSGVSFDGTTRSFSGTPAAGTSTITVTATDNGTPPLSVSDSFELSVAKAGQTITFGALADKTYGDSAFTVSASSSSGLAVAYSIVSGPATISGNTVTLTGTGTVTVRAAQTGDANHEAATAVDRSFTVAPATATVTLGGLSATYDGAAHSATATTNPSGLTVTFTYDGSSTAPTAAGAYAVVGTVTDANYSGSANGTLTLAKAGQSITFGALAGKTYGDSAFTVSASSSAGLPIAYSIVSGPATLSGNTVTLTGAGSVTVRAAQAGDANHHAAVAVDRSFTVTAATATVTLGSLDATYDGTAKSATATTSPAGLTVTFTYDGSSTAPTAAGSYAVVGTVTDANYSGSASGTLTLAKAGQSITFGALAGKNYGDSAFTVSASSSSNLTVAYSIVSGPANISGNTVTLTGTGTVTVRAAQAGDTNYEAASAVDRSFTVAPATATATLGDLGATYDGAIHSATATTNPVGLIVTFTYDGSPTAPTAAGSYAVVGTVTDANYSGSASGTLVIAKAGQTLTFAPVGTITAGETIALSATASSGLAVTYSLVSGPATLNGSNLAITGTGTVTVRAAQAGDANYEAATADLTFTVSNKLGQTIAFEALADHIGSDEPFTLSATTSSGLPVSFTVVSGPASLDGITLSLTGAAGTVLIQASQSGNDLYAAAPPVVRSFDVTQAVNRIYFGSVASPDQSHLGQLAMMLPPSGSAGHLLVVLASLEINLDLGVELADDGSFVCQAAATSGSSLQHAASIATETPHRLSTPLTVTGQLSGNVLTGTISPLGLNFTAPVQPTNGPAAALAGYYSADTLASAAGGVCAIVCASGAELVVVQTPSGVVGGQTTVQADGSFNFQVVGAGGTTSVQGCLDATTTALSGAVSQPGQPPTDFAGLSRTTTRTDRLINLSSRGQILGGDNIVITGFVISGHTAKNVLLRAVGPGLARLGVTGWLPTPRLQVYDAQGKLVLAQEGWGDAPELAATFARLGAFALPAGSADSAVHTTLAPGVYTMHVVSAGPATGIALAEIYDASVNPQGEYQRLVNISSRAQVGPDAGVLIGGFVVTGNSPKQVLVRGAGPALAQQGLSTLLTDPTVCVYAADGTRVARNDNWGTPAPLDDAHTAADAATIASAASAVGAFAFPAGSKDAALIVTLAPGAYSAVVSGTGSATGQALVEIYETP